MSRQSIGIYLNSNESLEKSHHAYHGAESTPCGAHERTKRRLMAGFLVPQRDKVVWRGTFEDLLPENHLARFIWNILSTFDFSELEARHRSINGRPGRPPYHPRLLAALWIYGLTQGVEKATKFTAFS